MQGNSRDNSSAVVRLPSIIYHPVLPCLLTKRRLFVFILTLLPSHVRQHDGCIFFEVLRLMLCTIPQHATHLLLPHIIKESIRACNDDVTFFDREAHLHSI